MTLLELRDFGNSSEYQAYYAYLQNKQQLDQYVSTLQPDHNDLINRLTEITQNKQQLDLLKSASQLAEMQVEQVTAKYRDSFQKLQDTNVLSAFYKESLEDITHKYLDELSTTLTEVYCSVYDKTDKQVQLVLEDYRGKKVVRLKYLASYRGNLYPETLDADGGSAQIILGLIIAMYFLLATNGPRIIFCDESLSALHTKTLQRFLAVLKRFASELQFVFVIVDHSPYRMKDYIDQIYLVEKGKYTELSEDEAQQYIESTKGDENEQA